MCKTLSAYVIVNYVEDFSMFTLTVISFERYAAVCKPLSTYAHSTTKRAILILCVGCLICTLLLIPNIICLKYANAATVPTIGAHCVHQLDKYDVGTVWHSLFEVIEILPFLVCVILILFCFTKTKKTLTKQVNNIKMNDNTQIAALRHVKRREKTLTTIILVTVSFFVFSTPVAVTFEMVVFSKLAWNDNTMQFAIVLWCSSCCINPFIYGFRSTLFRKGVKAILCKTSCFTKKNYSQLNEWSNWFFLTAINDFFSSH